MKTSKKPRETLKSLSAKEIKQIEQKSIKKHISKLLKEVNSCLDELDEFKSSKEGTLKPMCVKRRNTK